jgi:hypothetical protein
MRRGRAAPRARAGNGVAQPHHDGRVFLMARDEVLFEQNLKAFQDYNSEIYHYLKAFREPVMEVVGSVETGDINIDLGHTKFYEIDAASFAREQLAKFWESPRRFYIDPPPYPAPSTHHPYILSDRMHAYFKEAGIATVAPDATADAGYLLIFGIGLGFHLSSLFEQMDVRYFILIEEFPEFLYHTLWHQDWAAIFDRAKEKGQVIRFFFGNDPRSVEAEIHWYMRGEGFGLIDGSFIYRHYRSLLLDSTHDQFVDQLPLLPLSDGFFEDELVMLHNCGHNFARYDFHLLDVRPRFEKEVPAFIVGSGPSLDGSVETLRKYRDQVVVFSCGTGLSAMLKYGIRPDFHCELENVHSSYEHLRRLSDTYGPLDDIILLASSTVYPEMSSLFRRRIYFFRDSVSSTSLWCSDGQGLYGMAPTCTNLGLRASLLMGFRQIYLFGVDLGTRDATRHHSDASIYHTAQEWKLDIEQDPVRRMDIPMPGNFGGRARTNTILHWARMLMMQSLTPFPDARVYNCSDGVRITGTLPKLPRTLKLDTTPRQKQTTIDRLFRELLAKHPGAMLDLGDLDALRRIVTEWTRDFLALTEQAKTEKMGFMPFYEAAGAFIADSDARLRQGVIHSVYIGSMMMCFQIGYFFYRRVGEVRQEGMMTAFVDAIADRLNVMASDFDATLASLIDFAKASEVATV